jgi:hypothetical protein
MNYFKVIFTSYFSILIAACSHPIEIIGDGDVTSASGTRYCYLEDYKAGKDNCAENFVTGAYEETYYATPRDGWMFTGWEGCLNIVSGSCSFNVPADAVIQFWGKTAPPLKAIFALSSGLSLDDVQGRWVGTGIITAKLAPDQSCKWSIEMSIEGKLAYVTSTLVADSLPFIQCRSVTVEGEAAITESGKLNIIPTKSSTSLLETGSDGLVLSKDGRLQSQSEYVLSGIPYISVADYGRP